MIHKKLGSSFGQESQQQRVICRSVTEKTLKSPQSNVFHNKQFKIGNCFTNPLVLLEAFPLLTFPLQTGQFPGQCPFTGFQKDHFNVLVIGSRSKAEKLQSKPAGHGGCLLLWMMQERGAQRGCRAPSAGGARSRPPPGEETAIHSPPGLLLVCCKKFLSVFLQE